MIVAACVVAVGFLALAFIVGTIVLGVAMSAFDSLWRGDR